jgi:hypothetical protein
MANTGKQSPLGVNVIGSLLAGHDITTPNVNTFYINPVAESYYGKSKNNDDYEPGKIVNDTCLKWLTYALKEAWARTPMNGVTGQITPETYDAMLNIGQSRIAALGNSKPPTYQVDDPSDYWDQSGGPANSGLAIEGIIDHGQDASWDPWDSGDPAGSNPNSEVTKWGWIRALALQAYNEFYWNAKVTYTPVIATALVRNKSYTISVLGNTDFTSVGASSNTVGVTFIATGPGSGTGIATTPVIDNNPSYKDFTSSFLSADAFVEYSNKAIFAIQNAQTFLQGTYSNQDDLISADIAGISLSARAFGQDLLNIGKAIDLSLITKFGLPSALLQNLQKNNAVTQLLNLAMLSSGLTISEIENISNNPEIFVSKDQEQKLYGAFLAVNGSSLNEILVILNCKTKNLESLADLLNVKKIFPTSYRTLTVPIYNTEPGPTNSKTYYLLFINDALNPQLILPRIVETVGTIVPPAEPPIAEPAPIPVEEVIPEPIIPEPPPQTPDIPTGQLPPRPARQTQETPGGTAPTGGGGCVVLESYIPSIESDEQNVHNSRLVNQAWMIESNMSISIGTEDLSIQKVKVVKTLNDYQPCVRVTTKDNISLVCSTTAPLFTEEAGYVKPADILDKHVAVMKDGNTWFSKVRSVDDVGYKFVRVIDTGNNSFWAGEKDGEYILHHNALVGDRNNIDKK